MFRAYASYISGIILLTGAFTLQLLVSISLPALPSLDITRSVFNTTVQVEGLISTRDVRLGIWSPCTANPFGNVACLQGYGSGVQISDAKNTMVTISSAWTNPLTAHVVAMVVTSVAFIFCISTNLTTMLLLTVFSFLGAILSFIAFVIDLALFAHVKSRLRGLEIGVTTTLGLGFWLTFISFFLLILGGVVTYFERRRRLMWTGPVGMRVLPQMASVSPETASMKAASMKTASSETASVKTTSESSLKNEC